MYIKIPHTFPVSHEKTRIQKKQYIFQQFNHSTKILPMIFYFLLTCITIRKTVQSEWSIRNAGARANIKSASTRVTTKWELYNILFKKYKYIYILSNLFKSFERGIAFHIYIYIRSPVRDYASCFMSYNTKKEKYVLWT